MLDTKLIRNNLAEIADKLSSRGCELDIALLTQLEDKRKSLQTHMQELQNFRNAHAKKVGMAKAKGEDISPLLTEANAAGDSLKAAESQFETLHAELTEYLSRLPNLPHESVPIGKSEEDNVVIRSWGKPKDFGFAVKDHVDLGEKFARMDFDTGVKLTQSRFVVLRGPLAQLHRALIQFMLDMHTQLHGYEEIAVPFIVNAASMFGTGQLPKMKEDLFALAGDNELYLIPTAEVPVTNTIRDEILPENILPLLYTCHSPCFRSEAGSYGRDTRGMIRQHQFEKVELVQVVKPELSYAALENLTSHAENILQALDLPYRVVALCTGDLGFASAKTYDLEVWLPSQNCYREISSCSNMEAFQARRMNARWRSGANKPELVHTLNGSALAIGRTLVAILENYQRADGSIEIPEKLIPYLHGMSEIR